MVEPRWSAQGPESVPGNSPHGGLPRADYAAWQSGSGGASHLQATLSPTPGPQPQQSESPHVAWPGSQGRAPSSAAHSPTTSHAGARGVASDTGPRPGPRPPRQLRGDAAPLRHLRDGGDSGRDRGAAQRSYAREGSEPRGARFRGDPRGQDPAVPSLGDVGTDGLMSAHPGVSRFLRDQSPGSWVTEVAGGPGHDPGEPERRGYVPSSMHVQHDHVPFCPPVPPRGAVPSNAAGSSGLRSAAMPPWSLLESQDGGHPVHGARSMHPLDLAVDVHDSSRATQDPGQGGEGGPGGQGVMAQSTQAVRMIDPPAQPAWGQTSGSLTADVPGLRSGSHGRSPHARLLDSSGEAGEDTGAGAGPLGPWGWWGMERTRSEGVGPAERPMGAASSDQPMGEVGAPAQRVLRAATADAAFPLQRLGSSQGPLWTGRSSVPASGQGQESADELGRGFRADGREGPGHVWRQNAREQDEGAANPALLEGEVWEEQFRGLCLPAPEGGSLRDSRQPPWQEPGGVQEEREPVLQSNELHPSVAFHSDHVPMDEDVLPLEEGGSEHVSLVSAADLPSPDDFSEFCLPFSSPLVILWPGHFSAS